MIIFAIFIILIVLLFMISLKLKISFNVVDFEYYFRIDGYIFFHIFKEERGNKGNLKRFNKEYDNKINPITKVFNKYLNNILHPKEKINMPKHIFSFKEISFYIKIGLIDIMPTIYAIPIISTIVTMIVASKSEDVKKFTFKIEPVYDKLCLNLKLSSIVKIKLAHIIYMILMIFMEGVKKHGRPSNTRTHEYGDEQYKRYG